MFRRYLLLLSALTFSLLGFGQTALTSRVVDGRTGEVLPGAVITFSADGKARTISGEDGRFVIPADVKDGTKITISYVGYTTLTATLRPSSVYKLKPEGRMLDDVVVTATENRGLTSASMIGRHAMEHLQPSSFGDLLELLPGGRAQDPSLTVPNIIRLREAGSVSSQYDTSSLGTSFVIDGMPMSTNANMQFMNGASDYTTTSRDFTNAGVDMRSISTDDIQNVEIVRGIPTAEYGDLTSGLIKINRRRGGNDISARFKADMDSKLFYVAKGFEWAKRRLQLNISADWLDAKADPRNALVNYTRLTLSARLNKDWQGSRFASHAGLNLDYGGSFDKSKVDPELNYGGVDRYKQKYNRYALAAEWNIRRLQSAGWLRGAEAGFSLAYEKDITERTRLVQLDRDTPAATTRTEGESFASLLYPYTYTATHRVDGRPMNIFAKAAIKLAVPSKVVANSLKIGANWQMDKNYGRGQEFDPLHPLNPGISTRQRKYSDIPAENILSSYLQENLKLPLGQWAFSLEAGLRLQTLAGIGSRYDLHGKIYADPRINAGITLPPLMLAGKKMQFTLAGGYGMHTKFPTMDQLYPELNYIDLVEMNYWHTNREYRGIYLQTYIVDPTNHNLHAARNRKYELRLDGEWAGNRISVTWFREDMKSGFRSMAIYADFPYNKYDISGINSSEVTSVPNPATLPSTHIDELSGYYMTENGSRTLKQGWEYTLSTVRFPVVRTRLTITGAYFKTTYQNSHSVMELPQRVLSGERFHYAGIYKDDNGYIREMWNTNFTFDTDVPRLKLGFSVSAQCLWETASQTMPKATVPEQYIDRYGVLHDYTAADMEDAELQFLVRTNNSSQYDRQTVPFSMNLNFKATKKLFADHAKIALFVNKLLDSHHSYVRNDYRIRRYVTPYFGLEVNLSL